MKILNRHIAILLKSEIARLFPGLYYKVKFQRRLAIFLITGRCNLRCIMCNQWMQRPDNELDADAWKSIMVKIKEFGIGDIHFTGGEPLLREDLGELIEYGTRLRFTIGITTNGYLLNRDTIDRLVNSGLNSIAVSIDGVDEGYENIRGAKGSYEYAERALRLLAAYKSNKKVIGYINFTLMKPSLPEFYKVKRLADSLGLPVAINLLDYTPYCFNLKENIEQVWLGKESAEELNRLTEFLRKEKRKDPRSLIITSSAIQYINRYFSNPIQKQIPCIASQDRVFIDPYGKVLNGCLTMGLSGSLIDSSLEEILNKEEARKVHRGMFYKRCPGCSCGYLYNLQHHLPSLIYDIFKTRIF